LGGPRTLGVNDSLVIFFAGHGGTTTRVLQDGTTIETGYIIPVNAGIASWLTMIPISHGRLARG
jgi:hypothetical protein